MVFRIADNFHAPAAFANNIAFGNRVSGVVSAFGVNIWAQQTYKLGDVESVKKRDRIYITECGQNFRTFIAGNARAAFAFERTRARI